MIELYSTFENVYIKSKGLRKALLKFILLKLLRDPEIYFDIRGKRLFAHASHNLPHYVSEFPLYDELVSRVSNFLREKGEHLVMVDVGANIGDTIVASNENNLDMFLAVEGNPNFIRYLKKNCANIQNLRLVEAFLSSSESTTPDFTILETSGTARIVPGGRDVISVRTLDSIISENSDFQQFNFLKIDTDGYDFKVIAGGKDCIARSMPCVLFECDVSGNENYLVELRDTLNFLRKIEYSSVFLYDNFGYLFGCYQLNDLTNLKYPLFYQLTSQFYYFDILVMRPSLALDFQKQELQYFAKNAPNDVLRRLAKQVQTFPD